MLLRSTTEVNPLSGGERAVRGAVKKLKIRSFRQEARAGGQRSHAPAPPRWNARSARVLGCGFEAVICQDRANSIFSQLQALKL
jgi:hypothetical protein